ncbi:YybH family protein [Pseudonocardia humida]|uniref:SgcJ/EcaC family oxidoreductase n=1 Tax=Pseudonocardia humida TaxID=2800819 RepID=A0ABT0ZWM5_9PSEU|nr:SgcJ/EcaC family oxidoreductase [Pseudonocardia humida]MCO1655138.1 SgcJ/EcaC family oxidoreductase [Pseudonocardia humida]
MSDDEKTIRTQIERWAEAVHRGDLDAVLADRSPDVVMFDVPPPQDGVRGIDAYRATWPPFFAWLAAGALFEVVSVEVTAGVDVAFAHALLRCGMPDDLAADPDARLRITFGLRKRDGRWLVTHEHHSFPDASLADAGAVRALHERWYAATAANDLDGIMDGIVDDVVSFEHEAPLVHRGADAVREVCRGGLEASTGTVTWDVPDLEVVVSGDLAVGWGLNRVTADGREWWSRGTRVFRRRAGRWELTHQHVSYPYDPATGAALTELTP